MKNLCCLQKQRKLTQALPNTRCFKSPSTTVLRQDQSVVFSNFLQWVSIPSASTIGTANPFIKGQVWVFEIFISILTNPFPCYPSLNVRCTCVCFIYLYQFYQCFDSRENLQSYESNHQVCNFCKWVIFEKRRHCGTLSSKFLISANFSSNLIQMAVVN